MIIKIADTAKKSFLLILFILTRYAKVNKTRLVRSNFYFLGGVKEKPLNLDSATFRYSNY